MDPQTTNNTNNEVTDISSVKPNDQTQPVSQIGQNAETQNPQDKMDFGELFGQEEPAIPENKNTEPVSSLGNTVPENKSDDSLNSLIPGSAVEPSVQNLSEKQDLTPEVEKQKDIAEPVQTDNLNQPNTLEKMNPETTNNPVNQTPLDNQDAVNPLPPLPPLPKEQSSQIFQEGEENKAEKEEGHKKGSSKNVAIISIIFISIAVLALGGFLIYKNLSGKEVVTTFEECMTAEGSVLEESYPPVCLAKNGSRFVAEVPEMEEPKNEVPLPVEPQPLVPEEKTLAENCYEQVSDPECPEGTMCMANPASSFCECMGGVVDIREAESGEQYGMCLIGGSEYEEWEYYRMNTPKEGSIGQETTPTGTGPSNDATGSPFGDLNELKYTLDKSEGTCTADSECVWENQGCGGGHGVCTNEPEKYKDMVTACEVDPNFPSNLGYTCGCVETLGRCGWEK
jgi:putative hemolysin